MNEPTPSGAQPLSARHVRSLDGVRGVALSLVLMHSLNVMDLPDAGAFSSVLEHVFEVGWIGVQLFFVLSGYLITGILIDSRGSTGYLRSFYARRALRIWPLYYAVLVVFLVVVPFFGWGKQWLQGAEHQVWLWTYLVNWVEPYGQGVRLFSHFWSLAVEEQFYLIWPFVVRWCSLRQLAWVASGMVVVALLTRLWMVNVGASEDAIYMFTICRMDALAAGALVAIAMRCPSIAPRLERLGLPGLILFASGALVTQGYHRTGAVPQVLGYLLLTIVFAIVVASCAGESSRLPGRTMQSGLLVSIGRYSYGMYIFGMVLHRCIGEPFLATHEWVKASACAGICYTLLMISLTYVVAAISFHAFEIRWLRLKRFFIPRPALMADAEGAAS